MSHYKVENKRGQMRTKPEYYDFFMAYPEVYTRSDDGKERYPVLAAQSDDTINKMIELVEAHGHSETIEAWNALFDAHGLNRKIETKYDEDDQH